MLIYQHAIFRAYNCKSENASSCPLRAELKAAIDIAFGLELPATVVYDYPSINALATYVCGELVGVPGHKNDDAAGGVMTHLASGLDQRQPFVSSRRVILVTGSSARASTNAAQPAAPAAGDAIQRIPRARWDMQQYMVWHYTNLHSIIIEKGNRYCLVTQVSSLYHTNVTDSASR